MFILILLTVLYSYIHYYTYKIQKENVKSIIIVYDFISVNQRKSIIKNRVKVNIFILKFKIEFFLLFYLL